jgi:hypothetical protein
VLVGSVNSTRASSSAVVGASGDRRDAILDGTSGFFLHDVQRAPYDGR